MGSLLGNATFIETDQESSTYDVPLALIAIGCLLYMWQRKYVNDFCSLPPGPTPALVLGNLKDLDRKRVHQSLHVLSKKYGPILFIRLLKRKIVVLNTSEIITKAFNSDEFNVVFNDKPKGFFGTYMVFGHNDVLFGPYCDRTFKLKHIMCKSLATSMDKTKLQSECIQLCKLFEITNGQDVDTRDIIEKFLAEQFSLIISGEAKEGDSQLIWDFVNSAKKLLNPSVESLLKNLPFLRHWPAFDYNNVKIKRDNLLKRYLDDYRGSFKVGQTRGLVDQCLQIQCDDNKEQDGVSWLTDDLIRAMILDVIGGGLISTTNSILAAILNLLNNRTCLDKMMKEIETVLGNKRAASSNDISNMPYATAVVLETLRFSTLVPIVSHYCSTRDTTFENYTIPKNSLIWGNIWTAHHDASVFVDPWEFLPDRFIDSNGQLLPEHSLVRRALIPFGVGPRACLEQQCTYTRLNAYLATIVHNFDIVPPQHGVLVPCDPNLYSSGAALETPPFKCRFIKRTR